MANTAELRKILVLYPGGTIGMKRNNKGVLAPAPDVFTAKMKTCEELHDPDLARIFCIGDDELITKATSCNKVIAYQIKEFHPLLDSSNMTPKNWVILARNIEENYNDFDGFVILNGTDTLAYTSSILSFMIKNLQKNIVITGAQIPVFQNPNDGKSNFLTALVFASCFDIPEISVYFSNKLMRGNRVRKVHTSHYDAFDSPNYPLLAESGFCCRLYPQNMLPETEKGPLTVFTNLCESIGILYIFPTLTRTQLVSFLEPTLQGVVLITFGAGNFPSLRKDLLDALRGAICRGCMEEMGVISCGDMTVEAAYSKLAVVCGMTSKPEERTKLMKQNFSGEMTTK